MSSGMNTKQKDTYVQILPKCRVCGKRDFRVDKWMNKRNTRKMTCRCSGYWFPHREKSKWCIYNPNYPTEENR